MDEAALLPSELVLTPHRRVVRFYASGERACRRQTFVPARPALVEYQVCRYPAAQHRADQYRTGKYPPVSTPSGTYMILYIQYTPIHLYIHPSVRLSIHPFIHPSIRILCVPRRAQSRSIV